MKVRFSFGLALALVLSGCNETPQCNCTVDQSVIDANYKANGDLIEKKFEKTFLAGLDEMTLDGLPHEAYRIMYVSGKTTQIMRLENRSEGALLTTKIFTEHKSGRGAQVELDSMNERELSESEWDRLVRTISEQCTWTQLQRLESKQHAAYWMFEGHLPDGDPCTKAKYHKLIRRAGDGSEIEEMCIDLFAIAKLFI